MFFPSRIVWLFVICVLLTKWRSVESLESNATGEISNNEEEAETELENINFAEFKERYRRLIPYMTYYVANNYVNSQVSGTTQKQQGYDRETLLTTSPLIRKPQRLVPIGRPNDVRNESNGRGGGSKGETRGTLHKQETKFVPSIQYDPEAIGGDTDYFAPVRYNMNFNYDSNEYINRPELVARYREEKPQHRQQQQQRQRLVIHPEVTSSTNGIFHQDTRYYHNEGSSSRPLPSGPSSRPYNPLYERKYLPHKSNTPISGLHQDYPTEYGLKIPIEDLPNGGSDYRYVADTAEPGRHGNNKPPLRLNPKPTRILAQSLPTRPLLQTSSSIYSTGNNNPSTSLNDIAKSLRLTNRLPEMLNRNNVDSSIETLIEILGILNNDAPMDFSRFSVANPQRQNSPSQDHFTKIHSGPRVVTESRFPTNSHHVLPEPDKFPHRPETVYETNYKIVNDNKPENVVQYFQPLVQTLDEKKIDATYKPTGRPYKLEQQNEYEINQDFSDDLSSLNPEEEKYSLPATTETPISKFQLPDGPPTNQGLVAPTTLKFGATRGKPNVDYPAHAAIPETQFNCKEQRYKGFFGDPSTGCQVWHYCDLNGGKSSFLCPNGTIFSQVALTCDWWFNVKCESTTQLYVLNERLYKYILPVMPKFPEDFSGPEVDRYLELKFKEMEAKLKEKKLKKQKEKDKIAEKLQSLDSET